MLVIGARPSTASRPCELTRSASVYLPISCWHHAMAAKASPISSGSVSIGTSSIRRWFIAKALPYIPRDPDTPPAASKAPDAMFGFPSRSASSAASIPHVRSNTSRFHLVVGIAERPPRGAATCERVPHCRLGRRASPRRCTGAPLRRRRAPHRPRPPGGNLGRPRAKVRDPRVRGLHGGDRASAASRKYRHAMSPLYFAKNACASASSAVVRSRSSAASASASSAIRCAFFTTSFSARRSMRARAHRTLSPGSRAASRPATRGRRSNSGRRGARRTRLRARRPFLDPRATVTCAGARSRRGSLS